MKLERYIHLLSPNYPENRRCIVPFYYNKQSAIRDRRCGGGSTGALDGGELPLAFGCDILIDKIKCFVIK